MIVDHIHRELNKEIYAISGHYELLKEARLPFQGRELLYLVGHCVIDTSCCGVTGMTYALVPGFVVNWHERAADGAPVSRVEPIADEETRREIAGLIEREELVSQVNFL